MLQCPALGALNRQVPCSLQTVLLPPFVMQGAAPFTPEHPHQSETAHTLSQSYKKKLGIVALKCEQELKYDCARGLY